MRAKSFLVWGDVGLDSYDDEPAPRPGGCALNVALSLVASAAPGPVACAGPLGDDARSLRRLLEQEGVDATHLELREGPAPRQPIRLGPGGERELYGYQAGVLAGYRPSPLLLQAVAEADLVYLPVFSLTRAWAEEAWARREPGQLPVAVDLMDLSEVSEGFVRRAVERSALVFVGLDPRRQEGWLERLQGWAAQPGDLCAGGDTPLPRKAARIRATYAFRARGRGPRAPPRTSP